MVFKKCCFCIDIRKGCLVVATSGILITLLSLIVLILANIFDWSFYFKIAGCIIHLGGYGCLLYGARNENRIAIFYTYKTKLLEYIWSSKEKPVKYSIRKQFTDSLPC